MPAEQVNVPRVQLPRGLIGRRPSFRFAIGQRVEFYGDRALIAGRQSSAAGRELYDITIDCADRPQRTVLGAALSPLTTNAYRAAALDLMAA